MNERNWAAIATQTSISNGGTEGQLSVPSTDNIKVKMKVYVTFGLNQINLEVKRVLNTTDLILGPIGKAMTGVGSTTNLSAFPPGTLLRIDEQQRPSINPNEINRAVYEEEPTVAIRTIDVGPLGNLIDWHEDGLVPQEYDDVQLLRDDDGDITDASFYLSGALIRHLVLTYDLNKDVIRVQKAAGSL